MSVLDISETLMSDYIKPKYKWNCIQRSCAQQSSLKKKQTMLNGY